MVNRPKQIGTTAESAVVKVARAAGFHAADRHILKGGADEGDIWLLPTGGLHQIVIEVKGGHAAEQASDAQILKWLDETDAEVANVPTVRPGYAAGTPTWALGFLVTKRKGVGVANAHRWWAHMTLETLSCFQRVDGLARPYEKGVVVRMTLASALHVLFQEDWR